MWAKFKRMLSRLEIQISRPSRWAWSLQKHPGNTRSRKRQALRWVSKQLTSRAVRKSNRGQVTAWKTYSQMSKSQARKKSRNRHLRSAIPIYEMSWNHCSRLIWTSLRSTTTRTTNLRMMRTRLITLRRRAFRTTILRCTRQPTVPNQRKNMMSTPRATNFKSTKPTSFSKRTQK